MTNSSNNSPVIFKGTRSKLLTTNGIEFKDGTYFLTGTTDPTIVPTSAPLGSMYLDTTNGYTYKKQDNGSSTNWFRNIYSPAQLVTVAKSGGDFTTIQAAINSILDASAAKPYVVKIYPGVYSEALTVKDYVSLSGVASLGSIVITNNDTVLSGTLSDLGLNTVFSHLTIVHTPVVDNKYAVNVVGSYGITDCLVLVQTSSNVTCNVFNINTNGAVAVINTTPRIDNAYVGSTKDMACYTTTGSGLFTASLTGCFINASALSGTISTFSINGANPLQLTNFSAITQISNINFSGNVYGYNVMAASAGSRIVEYGDVRLKGAGAGTGTFSNLNSGGNSAEIFYSGITVEISGFISGQEYISNTALGDTQKIWLSSANKNLPKTGTGLAIITPYDLVQTGFVGWSAAAGNYWSFDSSTKIFTVLKRGTGIVMSAPVVWTANQAVTLTDLATNIVYIDSSGVLKTTTNRTDAIYEGNIGLFEVWVQNGNSIVCKENHPAKFSAAVSNSWHDLFGPLLQSASQTLAINTAATRTINLVGTNTLTDHGLDTDITAQTPVTWIQIVTGVSGHMTQIANSSSIASYKSDGTTVVNATALVANTWYQILVPGNTDFTLVGAANSNAGTVFKATGAGVGTGTTTRIATIVANNRYVVYRLGVVKDSLNSANPTFICSADSLDYSSVANATTAINSGLVLPFPVEAKSLEIVQLGFAIVHANGSAAGTLDANSVITALQVFGASFVGGGVATAAALITTNTTNFDKILSGTDINVQTALETIDENASKKETGDLPVTSYNILNNQVAPINVTGLLFANASVWSFRASVAVYINATSSLYESIYLYGIQRGADWVMTATSTGDESLIAFTITNAGQIQYTSGNYAGFNGSGTSVMKFRAWALPV